MASLTITTPGHYLFNFSLNVNISSGTFIWGSFTLVGTNAPVNNSLQLSLASGAPGMSGGGCIFVPNASGLYYITMNSNLTTLYATGGQFNYFQAVRIG